MEKEKNCFVISPIGDPDTPQRKRADTVLKHIFKPALEPLGYVVIRADEISTPGSITLQVLERVLESSVVLADLTDHNPNVFYELAVRHAAKRPVIHVIASNQKIPFDVADLRTIPLDTDLDGAERTRAQIRDQVKNIEAGHVGETPVTVAGALKQISNVKSDENLILKQILEGMTEMKGELRSLGSKISPVSSSRRAGLFEATVVELTQNKKGLAQAVERELSDYVRSRLKETEDEPNYLAKFPRDDGFTDYVLITARDFKASVLAPSDIPPSVVGRHLMDKLRQGPSTA